MIGVIETEDGFEVSWDPNDPIECVLNGWTDEDFIEAIVKEAERVLVEHEGTLG